MMAALLLWSPRWTGLPDMAGSSVHPDSVQVRALRAGLPSPPTIEVAGFDMNCVECHDLFATVNDPPHELGQHQHIRLNHGMNDRCLNCHDTSQRDKLVLHGQQQISFDEVHLLCAKCHGPTFRDWERGIHGRSNGYWDASRGAQERLTCTRCHDPHSPAFPGIAPLPGPQTLRMGPQGPKAMPGADHGDSRNPLSHGRQARALGRESESR